MPGHAGRYTHQRSSNTYSTGPYVNKGYKPVVAAMPVMKSSGDSFALQGSKLQQASLSHGVVLSRRGPLSATRMASCINNNLKLVYAGVTRLTTLQ